MNLLEGLLLVIENVRLRFYRNYQTMNQCLLETASVIGYKAMLILKGAAKSNNKNFDIRNNKNIYIDVKSNKCFYYLLEPIDDNEIKLNTQYAGKIHYNKLY